MKSLMLLLSFTFVFFTSFSAKAELVEAVKIHADYFPSNDYSIGLDLDSNHLITQIYFDQNGSKTFFPLDHLNDFVTIFQTAGITLVQMRIASHEGSDKAVIELNYTQNCLSGNRASMNVGVAYNGATGHYDVTDLRSNQLIHEVNVHTRYNFLRLPIGISAIETH